MQTLGAQNLRAMALMTLAMALFAVEDACIKVLSQRLPLGQILLVLGLGGMVVFAFLLRRRQQPLVTRQFLHPVILARNIGELIGVVGFVTALSLISLSVATTILQAAPLIVTMGAALALGEAVGWRRWSAIAAGFAGVMLIVRPGLSDFDPQVLWAVVGVAGLSVRDLATRRIPADISTQQLSLWAYGVTAVLGLVWSLGTGVIMPGSMDWALLAACLMLGSVGYWSVTEAMRIGEVSAVAPLRYSRLLFGLAIGAFWFLERMDGAAMAGATIILVSGLYLFHRERRLAALSRAVPVAI